VEDRWRRVPPWCKWVLVILSVIAIVGTITAGDGTSGRHVTTAPVERVTTFSQAEQAVNDGDFVAALAIADTLGANDQDRIRRKISRTLARDVHLALRRKDRTAAKVLLTEAVDYPTTPHIRTARISYRAAKARAARTQSRAGLAAGNLEARRLGR
jgi:hypothetical protein